MKRKNGMTLWILLVSLLFVLAGCGGGGGGGSSTGGGGTDATAPSAPSALVLAAASSSSISLNWTASTDDVGVTGYKIFRGGTQISTSATNSFSDSGLTASTTYSYTVAAYDAAGNTSTQSTSASATTLAAGGTATSGANFKMPDTNQTTSYTTTFGEDHDYTINPPSYTDNGNGTIKDNVTSLVWQKQDDGTTRTWSDGVTYCDNLTLGGQTDWRLPSRIELISIVDYGIQSPSINTTFFPNTKFPSANFWSSVTSIYNTPYAWGVEFSYGNAVTTIKTDYSYVRCVRG